jgi:hypothetical protein
MAATPSHPVAGRDAAKKRELEARDGQARAALQQLRASG